MNKQQLIILIIFLIILLYFGIVFYIAWRGGYYEPTKSICSDTYMNFSNLTIR
jgi:flagellar basal body-associated protein FliL